MLAVLVVLSVSLVSGFLGFHALRRHRLHADVRACLAQLAPPSRASLKSAALQCQKLPRALAAQGWAVLATRQGWRSVQLGRPLVRRWLPADRRCLVLVDAASCRLLSPALRQAWADGGRLVEKDGRLQVENCLIVRIDAFSGRLVPLVGASATLLQELARSELPSLPAMLRSSLAAEFQAMGLVLPATEGAHWRDDADLLGGLRAAERAPERWLGLSADRRPRIFDATGRTLRQGVEPRALGIRWLPVRDGCRHVCDSWDQVLYAEQWRLEGRCRRVRTWSWLRRLDRPGIGFLRNFEERVVDRHGRSLLTERLTYGSTGRLLLRERWQACRTRAGAATRFSQTRWQSDGVRTERCGQRGPRGQALRSVTRAFKPDGSLLYHRSWRARRPRRCVRVANNVCQSKSDRRQIASVSQPATAALACLPGGGSQASWNPGMQPRRGLTLVELLMALLIVALLSTSVLLSMGGSSDEAAHAWLQDLQARMQAELDLAYAHAVQQSARAPVFEDWDAPGFAAKTAKAGPEAAPPPSAKQYNPPPTLSPWAPPLAMYWACQEISARYAEAGFAAIMVQGGLRAVYLSSPELEGLAEPGESCLVLYDALGMQLQGLADLQLFRGFQPVFSLPSAQLPDFSEQLVFRARPLPDRLALEPFELAGSSALRTVLQSAARGMSKLHYSLALQHFRAMGVDAPRFGNTRDFDYSSLRFGSGQDFNDFLASVVAWQERPVKLSVEHSQARLVGDPGDAALVRLQRDLQVRPGEAFELRDAGLRVVYSREPLPEGGELEIRRIVDEAGNLHWEEFHRPNAQGRSINRFEYAVDLLDPGAKTLVGESLRFQDNHYRTLNARQGSYDPFDGSRLGGSLFELTRDAQGQAQQAYRLVHGTRADGEIESWQTDFDRQRATRMRAVYRRPDGSILAEELFQAMGGYMAGMLVSSGWQYFQPSGQPMSEEEGDTELRAIHWPGGAEGFSQLPGRLRP